MVRRGGKIECGGKGGEQVSPHRTTGAAVGKGQDILFPGGNQFLINGELAEIIHQNHNLPATWMPEQMIDKGRFTCPQKAGKHGHWKRLFTGLHGILCFSPARTVPQMPTSLSLSAPIVSGSSSRIAKSAHFPTSIEPTS